MRTWFLATDIGGIRFFSRDKRSRTICGIISRKRYRKLRIKLSFILETSRICSLYSVLWMAWIMFSCGHFETGVLPRVFSMGNVRTSVIGTVNMLAAATDESIECVICLSADKATYAFSSMGMSDKTRICSRLFYDALYYELGRICGSGTVYFRAWRK